MLFLIRLSLHDAIIIGSILTFIQNAVLIDRHRWSLAQFSFQFIIIYVIVFIYPELLVHVCDNAIVFVSHESVCGLSSLLKCCSSSIHVRWSIDLLLRLVNAAASLYFISVCLRRSWLILALVKFYLKFRLLMDELRHFGRFVLGANFVCLNFSRRWNLWGGLNLNHFRTCALLVECKLAWVSG